MQPKTVTVDKAEPGLSAEKRKTSRISLEAVLGGEGGTGGEGGPKTIRLKRPGDAGRVKVSAVPETVKKEAAEAEETFAGAPTIRKAVRVKRPAAEGGKPALTIARPRAEEAAQTPAAAATAPVQLPAADRVNPIFPLLTLAAVLVLCVTIYMLCAQAFGPNVSLTQYSYAKTGPELPWPGKLFVKP